MKNTTHLPALLALLSALYLTGCEINPRDETLTDSDTGNETAAPATGETAQAAPAAEEPQAKEASKEETKEEDAPPTTEEPTGGSGDDLDISSADLLGPHDDDDARGAPITRTLHSANVEGGNVRMSFDTLNWPTRDGSKSTDGGVYIFWQEGSQVLGGFFDHHGVGQTVKTLSNVHGGYLDGRKPPSGATVYFAIISYDVDQRTNVKRSDTTW